jgi:pimeloyl-ACP methyl ester carboxylesterase
LRKRVWLGALAVPLLLAAALLLWPEKPPQATGAWMQRAGVTPAFLDVDGRRIRYVRRGSGPPLVLVHGFSSSIYTWAEALPLLARQHDVIAVDLPGFGGSDIPPRFDSRASAEFLSRVMDGLAIRRASLAGNSLGGALSAVTAGRHPERVDRLILLDSAAYNFSPEDRPPLLRLAGRLPGWLMDSFPQRRLMRLGLKQVYFDDSKVTPEKVEEYLAPMARPGAQAAARRLLSEGDGFGLPGVLKTVRAPTLVIWGAEDAWIPVSDADRFVQDIPGARKVILERCGHVPQEERPQEVAQVMLSFLAQPAAAAAPAP